MKNSILFLTALITIGNSIYGEEKIFTQRLEESIISSENFQVTVIDTPKNITVITQEELEKRGVKNIAEALKGVPSLSISSMSGSDPKFDLRGQGDTAKSNVLVLLDGIPLNSIDLSGYKTNQIDISQVDRIEVVPSGGSVLYGDGAVGGIINIITKSPQDKNYYGSVGIESGSYDLMKFYGTYGAKISNNFLVQGNYSTRNQQGYRDEAKDDLDTFNIQGKYLLNDGFLSLGYTHSKNAFHAPGSLTKEQLDADRKQDGGYLLKGINNEDLYNLNFEKKLTSNLQFMIYGNHKEQKYKSNNTYNSKYNYNTKLDFIKPQIKYSYLENNSLILGMDYLKGTTDIKQAKYGTLGKRTKESFGGFALNKIKYNDFEFSQGYRRQSVKYDFFEGNSKENKKFNEDAVDLSVNYAINETSSTYLSYTSAFRTPNTDELGRWDDTDGLKPQTSGTVEFGGKTLIGNTYLSGAIFKTDTKNEILYDKEGNGGSGANKNLDGKTERVGIELFLEHYFDKLTLRESFSYIHHKIKNGIYGDKQIPGVPNYLANIGATYNFTSALSANADLYYNGSSYSSSDFLNSGGKNDSYITLDLSAAYMFNNGVSIYGGINNITNEKYNDYTGGYYDYSNPTKFIKNYYPAAERNFYVGIRYSF